MLLKIVCLHVAVVCVFAAPSTDVVPLEKHQPTVIPILEQSEELEPNGTYKFSYETGNGIKREEISYDKVLPRTRSALTGSENDEQNDEDNEIHVQQGSYFYTAPDGTLISLRYIADENGFQPIGDHLPKPPPILVAATDLGRSAKTADNAEGSSATVAVVTGALETTSLSKDSKTPESLVLESRIRELSSAVSASTATQDPSTTPEAPSTTEGTSTTESPVSTTKLASVNIEPLSSNEVISTKQTKTSEAALTPEPTVEPSTTGEPSSTAAASTTNYISDKSTPSLEATTEAVIVSA